MKHGTSTSHRFFIFINRLSLCLVTNSTSVQGLTMNEPANYHGYPTTFNEHDQGLTSRATTLTLTVF